MSSYNPYWPCYRALMLQTVTNNLFGGVCFWHPVGAHAGESLEEIVERKNTDIDRYGYTLWSFSLARADRVFAWRRELRSRKKCLAVCCGDATRDPGEGSAANPYWAAEFSDDLVVWNRVPHRRMASYHRPARTNGLVASAFVVSRIIEPDRIRVQRPSSWFRAHAGTWETSVVPTRGEYLVRVGEPTPSGASVRLLLEVKDPYVVWLR